MTCRQRPPIEAQESNTTQVNQTPRIQESCAVPEAKDPLAEGNLLFEQREKEEGKSTDDRTNREGHPVLSETDIKHVTEILKIHIDKIARKSGYQSTIENGQHMITEPGLDQGSDAVGRCGTFTNSKDQPDTTLIYRFHPNATIVPILSIRATWTS